MQQDKRCRVCLHIANDNKSLLVPCLNNISYFDVFNSCTKLEAAEDDDLPQYMCANCCQELLKYYNFLLKAKETQQKLRQQSGAAVELSFDKLFVEVAVDAVYSKDPLEAAELDEHSESSLFEAANATTINFSEDDDEDEDFNKPLKQLLLQDSCKQKSIEQPASIALEEEPIADLAISAEAQIFPQGRFRCQTCDRAYFTNIGLQTHAAIHLPKDTAKKQMRLGNKKSKKQKTNDENLVAAVATEIAAAPPTTITPTTEPSKPKQPKPKKIFPCHVCGKHMISASKLRYHLVMHSGEKNYLCTMCPKAYSTIYALKHHIRTHNGERPYCCIFCGDRFHRPTTLKSHMRRHTGERPYGCDICGKRFIQHSSMTTHMKLNHMEKNICCPHCDKKYARQTDLNAHLLSHTGDKRFACSLCSSRFVRQANLNKHMNQQHSSNRNEKKLNHKEQQHSNASFVDQQPMADIEASHVQ